MTAFDGDFEKRYATETPAVALAAGAVPIHFGDGDAATRVFCRRTTVDAREFFNFLRRPEDKKTNKNEADKAAAKVSAADRAAAITGVGEGDVDA